MELARVFLLGALFLIAFMLWNAWQNEHVAPAVTGAVVSTTGKNVGIADKSWVKTPPLPGVAQQIVVDNNEKSRFIEVKTDVLDVLIDKQGGSIVQAKLLKYDQNPREKNTQPFKLLSSDAADYYVAQSGVMDQTNKPTIHYQTSQNSYVLTPGQKELVVKLVGHNPQSILVDKQFVFKLDDYQILVNYKLLNQGRSPWQGRIFSQLQQKKPEVTHSLFNISAYTGGAISTQEKPYQKISFEKMGEGLSLATQNGWAAMLQHYFLSAWVPPTGQTHQFYSAAQNGIYTLGILGPSIQLAPGQSYSQQLKLYTGPDVLDRLKAVAPHLDLTVDYGILWFISMALFWLLKQIYQIVGNWGWAIVILTVLIKLAFYHLSAKSYRSMAAMRNLQPRLAALKARYGDDRQKLTQETMALYKAEKVNPLGGCLPILVQIPVFIALYWMILESVELRQAPFILWIRDLSVKDPYYILPILMGVTMFIQQKLNPPPADPTQAKVMQFLPIFFTALFLNFPAGLVLYWVVNNTLSILQQWFITYRYEMEISRKKKR